MDTASPAQTITVTNSGPSLLAISGISLTGANTADFTQTSNCPISPATIAVNGTCSINVTFAPQAAGVRSAAISIADDGEGSPSSVSLSGTGTAVSSLSCGNASMTGAGTDSCTVTLNAAAPAGGLVVNLSSNNAWVTVPATVTVPASAASVGFTATVSSVATPQPVTLTATSGGISTNFALQLNAAAPTLSINANSVPFGNVEVDIPATQSVTLTSTGSAAVTVSAVTVTGAGFSVSGATFPVTLNPGQWVTLSVQFDPAAAGAASGQLTVTSNSSSGATAVIGLSGTGTTPWVDLSWDAPDSSADPVTGYNVYRSKAGSSSYALLTSPPDANTTYDDSTVQSGQTYDYYVTGVDASGVESGPSNVISVAVP